MNKNFTFMAISFGKASVEGTNNVKRYIGVAPVSVLAVNPKAAELAKIYNREITEEPNYMGVMENTTQARIDFIVKNEELDFITKVSFFVRKCYRFNKEMSKCQVIDKYGRTCWVTKEQCAKHEIPMYSNGPANIDKDYRPLYQGEEELTNFIKNWANVPNVMTYKEGTWVMVSDPTQCECAIDVEKIFKGDFSELQAVAKAIPDHKVKVLFGVKTSEDGKQYQAFYTQMTMKNGTTNYSKLEKDLNERKAAGAYPTTTFEICPVKEYVVEATNLSAPTPANDPFASTDNTNTGSEEQLPW